jgi:uncharacterized protein YdeI (YjbR/CyaY-like superfamily)
MDELPMIQAESEQAWEAWLEAHHADATEVWLKLAKKGSGQPSVTLEEAARVAVCFGWVDSQAKGLDEQFWLLRYTPRRPRSKWSKSNCVRALEMIAAGRMRPAGLREVEAAQADGRWAATYDAANQAAAPDDQ